MNFRPAGPADAAAIARLHADSWRRHYRGALSDSHLDGDIVAEREAVWASRLATAGPTLTVLAEAGDELAGFVHVVFDHDERWGSFIDNLPVRYGRKRSGVGTALMARVAAGVAERASGRSYHLWVLERNVAAQRFYEVLGGRRVEQAAVLPPGGVDGRLHGAPRRFRYAWDGL